MPVTTSELRAHTQQQRIELSLELDRVEQTVFAALDGLQAPFNQFVIGQLRQVLPLRRAAVVLTGGLATVDSAQLCGQRINLAAAQEVLHLALHIHMRLIGQGAAFDDQSRSLLGSTILAGDFCFSRSAELAVHTGNPLVVEIFAETLKRVSEGHLRLIFSPDSPPFEEESALFDAGMHAAGTLAGLTSPVLAAARAQARRLATGVASPPSQVDLDKTLTELLTGAQLGRWRALIEWMQAPVA